jgi:hypothetical protein
MGIYVFTVPAATGFNPTDRPRRLVVVKLSAPFCLKVRRLLIRQPNARLRELPACSRADVHELPGGTSPNASGIVRDQVPAA